MARKSNSNIGEIDKTSFFFVQNCGVCHPGGAAAEFDRKGFKYYDRATAKFGYELETPARTSGEVTLDGDYALVNPNTHALTPAPWKTTGVAEADCFLCHLPGYSWKNRAGALNAGAALKNDADAGVPAFEVAPTAGAGWAQMTFVDPLPFPPKALTATINYTAGVKPDGTTAVTPANWGTYVVKKVPDANCLGCHQTPDRKKSGRSFAADRDVHHALGCVTCHPAGRDATKVGPSGVAINAKDQHEIAKGDITIGSVRNDVDDTAWACADCHLTHSGPVTAVDPSAAHADLPPVHFDTLECQVCHIRYLEDSPSTSLAELPELVLDMATNGRQVVALSDKYLGTDPLDPTQDLDGVPNSRWYPKFRRWKDKYTTVKPLLSMYYGDWISGTGDSALIRPLILRHIRTATGVDASGNVTNTNLTAVLADDDGDGLKEVNTEAEIKAYLEVIAAAKDPHGNDIATNPVLVKADKIFYLDGNGALAHFESTVAESHDFGVNHNVLPKEQAWGAAASGGCTECHSQDSAFFHTRLLADPLDTSGQHVYVERWEAMGLSAERVATLTAGVPSTTGPDAGTETDAGTSTDAGTQPDAGTGEEPPATGCGCSSTSGAVLGALPLLLWAALRRRRSPGVTAR